jgi:hypothetical protein
MSEEKTEPTDHNPKHLEPVDPPPVATTGLDPVATDSDPDDEKFDEL